MSVPRKLSTDELAGITHATDHGMAGSADADLLLGHIAAVEADLAAAQQGPRCDQCGRPVSEDERAAWSADLSDFGRRAERAEADLALVGEQARVAIEETMRLRRIATAAKELYERVEMDESVGICLSDRAAALRLGDALSGWGDATNPDGDT